MRVVVFDAVDRQDPKTAEYGVGMSFSTFSDSGGVPEGFTRDQASRTGRKGE